MKQEKMALFFLLFAVVSFSLYEVVSKTVIGKIDPVQLTFLRFLIGGVVLLPMSQRQLKKRGTKLQPKDFAILLGLGILNVGISMNLIQIGYKYTSANISAIIISANPIVVAAISSLVLKEKLSLGKALGLMLGIAGVSVSFLGGGQIAGGEYLLGVLLQVAGMFAFSFYTVLGKSTAIRLGSATMTAYTDILGAAAILPVLLIRGINPVDFAIGDIWMQMIYLCIINTGVAFFLYFRALEAIDTSLGAMTFFIKPLLASIFAAIFLHEALTIQIVVGILMVAGGIYLVLNATRKKKVVVAPE